MKRGRLELPHEGSVGVIPEGQLGRGISGISENVCRTKCDVNPKCKSFAYSMSEAHCKLQSKHLPPVADSGYKDFSWCSEGI